ncbi:MULTISPECIES: hypothetical protein [Methylotenera]|uniref:hypothetical protein n=1 Tax=Methylotenera TaxID=359407 RepID=UPI00036FE762|nr:MULTISPECIES: hypothetical protein [Methylotenera]
MTKTQMHLADIDISQIINEVKKNGFYTSFCEDLVNGVGNHNELILLIKMIAKSANLKVSFNATESVCIFEDLAT